MEIKFSMGNWKSEIADWLLSNRRIINMLIGLSAVSIYEVARAYYRPFIYSNAVNDFQPPPGAAAWRRMLAIRLPTVKQKGYQTMKEEEIPDYNIFMMCERINKRALTDLNTDYYFRNCRQDELELWKAFPFDSDTVPVEYEDFMNQIINDSYSGNMDTFFKNTLFVCNKEGRPVATCSYWKAYGKINTIHWLKTLKAYEGKGIGRAVLSAIMRRFDSKDYPIYIHTQPGSFRAIKLYSDFGFQLLRGGRLGSRMNELEKCLPILKEFMSKKDYECLKIIDTPDYLIELLESETTIQF